MIMQFYYAKCATPYSPVISHNAHHTLFLTTELLLCTYSEKNEESLILFSHTVVDPRTVMIHLPDASLTNTAGRKETMMHGELTAIICKYPQLHCSCLEMFSKAYHEAHAEADLQWWALSGLMLQHFGHL